MGGAKYGIGGCGGLLDAFGPFDVLAVGSVVEDLLADDDDSESEGEEDKAEDDSADVIKEEAAGALPLGAHVAADGDEHEEDSECYEGVLNHVSVVLRLSIGVNI